jgi:K+-transporting ATPase A subunit
MSKVAFFTMFLGIHFIVARYVFITINLVFARIISIAKNSLRI